MARTYEELKEILETECLKPALGSVPYSVKPDKISGKTVYAKIVFDSPKTTLGMLKKFHKLCVSKAGKPRYVSSVAVLDSKPGVLEVLVLL